MIKKLLLASVMACGLALAPFGPAIASDDDDDEPKLGAAGLLSKKNRGKIPDLTLSAGMPLLEGGKIELKSGTYYELEIEADGSQELALVGPEFFRAIWINEVVINDLEIRPFGIESLEFDDEGTMEIEFIAIKPGQYFLRIPGSSGESQRVDIIIQ